ncbi:hypothetical protein DSW25_15470 [Sulfitobacter donghicola DSW-25 = KCTC 12864 = JCM 14565]|uniref:Yip1 domain-containing protein n=1 Tax=Sulfitobacter donghicola DSW-25 = KCTC 12864 = JCM 14565 TaxID=1300350 RepID=A0A073ISX0_9RHOB|nr:hypothetical protein DSW25_15470 [Sulfitobacter donghicola DSW-25 = KCTC 12864 = JCM 14565]
MALETITTPRSAAKKIIGLYLSRDVLWSALALVACVNSLINGAFLFFVDTASLPGMVSNPVLFFVITAGLLVLSVHAFYWTGRALGGQADLGDVLALMVWLHALQAAAQVVLFVLAFLSPNFAQFLSFGINVVALWVIVNFIAQAHRFPNLLYAIGTIVLAMVGIAFGLVILAGLIGLGTLGVPTNV